MRVLDLVGLVLDDPRCRLSTVNRVACARRVIDQECKRPNGYLVKAAPGIVRYREPRRVNIVGPPRLRVTGLSPADQEWLRTMYGSKMSPRDEPSVALDESEIEDAEWHPVET